MTTTDAMQQLRDDIAQWRENALNRAVQLGRTMATAKTPGHYVEARECNARADAYLKVLERMDNFDLR